MSKKIVLAGAVWAIGVALTYAQTTLREVFIDMPDSVSGVLTKMNREDGADFLASGMKAEVTNRYGRQSELTQLTDNYLRVQATPQCVWEMKLLPLNDSVRIVCWVRSVSAPVCDSRVSFFTTHWSPLPADDYFRMPTFDAFCLPADSAHADSLALLRQAADMELKRVALSPDSNTLSVYDTTLDYLGKDAPRWSAYLRKEPLRYEWRDGKFRLLGAE